MTGPTEARAIPNSIAELQRQRQLAEARIKASAIGVIKQSVAVAVGDLLESINIELTAWASRLASALSEKNTGALQGDLMTLGREAQLRMLNAYGQLVTRQEGPASRTHYRAGQGRLAGGILLRALGRGDFFEVHGTTLSWGNVSMLDGAARQWHRIAFGAGRGGIHDEFAVTFNDLVLATIGVAGGPSPGFSMPAGIWVPPGSAGQKGALRAPSGGRGDDEFYPHHGGVSQAVEFKPGHFTMMPNLSASEMLLRDRGRPRKMTMQGPRPTRGIKPHDFFNAGVRYLAGQAGGKQGGLGMVLERYANNLTKAWVDSAGRMQKTVRVNVVARGL